MITDLPLISGIVMSIIHVISGPDHLAAVTPLAIEGKKKSWGIGFAWGTGHIPGMIIIGIFFHAQFHIMEAPFVLTPSKREAFWKSPTSPLRSA